MSRNNLDASRLELIQNTISEALYYEVANWLVVA
jgi:hypothetical protein